MDKGGVSMLAKYFCVLLLLFSMSTWSYTSSEDCRFILADSELSFMLIFPELTLSIYQDTSFPFLWDPPELVNAFEFQLSLIEQAKVAHFSIDSLNRFANTNLASSGKS